MLDALPAQEPLDTDTLRDYIAYARARVKPRMNDAAAGKLASVYMEMRRDGKSRKVSVSLKSGKEVAYAVKLLSAALSQVLPGAYRSEGKGGCI